jgi:hypothetical protein
MSKIMMRVITENSGKQISTIDPSTSRANGRKSAIAYTVLTPEPLSVITQLDIKRRSRT